MPKISKKAMKLKEGDLNEMIEFTINYNTDNGFYAELPAHLNEPFDQLTDADLKKLSASRLYRYKYSGQNGEHKRIVKAETELGVESNMKTICMKLLTTALVKVPVIIVTFENHSNRHTQEKSAIELPKVGLEIHATYCFQVSTGSTKPKYYTYEEREWFGETKIDRQEVSVHHSRDQAVIIPDTPENRQFIEDLHAAMVTLVNRMELFTKSSESMLAMIDQRQKLLS